MARFSLVGSSYTSQSPNADDEYNMNCYEETNESPNAKSSANLYSVPGKGKFATIPQSSGQTGVRGIFEFTPSGSSTERLFAVGGTNFCEIFADGTVTVRGSVASDTNPASIVAGPTQLLVASAGLAYVYDLTANILTPIDPATILQPVSQIAYCDGFFMILQGNSGEFQVSTPDDASTWSLGDVDIVSVFPDNVTSMIVAFRQPWMLGPKQSQVYYDSGALFPFDVVSGGFVEQGCCATYSTAIMDNSVFWLGGDPRGRCIVWRANGYTPVRVSNHAIEFAMQSYSKVSDAIGFAFQQEGHTFYQLNFPTANVAWVLDAENGKWHQRGYWDGSLGRFVRDHAQCHAFAFGKHLMGDWMTGNIYEQSLSIYTDNGNPLRWVRRAPNISNEQTWIYHQQLQIDLETGLGPQPPLLDGSGEPRGPIVSLRWSDDGGHTWSSTYDADAGKAGEYRKRVMFRRLGRSRDRVYEISGSDPVPYRIVDAYLLAEPSFNLPSERIATQYRKVS